MSKRKEKFCDIFEKALEDRQSLREPHPLTKEGHCVEPAIGTCSKCQRDYCSYHGGKAAVELKISYSTLTWSIPLCKDCSDSLCDKGFIIPSRLRTGFKRLARETAQWLGKKGHYVPKPKLISPEEGNVNQT